jgi:hypothetical protein
MRLSKEALLEVMAIVQDGIMGIKDASKGLRELDFVACEDDAGVEMLALSEDYTKMHPRASTWANDAEQEPSAGDGSLN